MKNSPNNFSPKFSQEVQYWGNTLVTGKIQTGKNISVL